MGNELFSEKRTLQKRLLEAVIFAADEPLSIEALTAALQNLMELHNGEKSTEQLLTTLIEEINQELAETERPYRIVQIAGGYQFATTAEFGKIIAKVLAAKSARRLSRAALETLAIIAYKQPVTKPEIDAIRGVRSDEVLQTLLQRDLITVVGRSDSIGRPLLYGTTQTFLKAFGLNSLEDLPKLREIEELLHDLSENQETITLTVDENLKELLSSQFALQATQTELQLEAGSSTDSESNNRQ